MTTTNQVYMIREINGTDYYSESCGWTPASSEATEYDTIAEARVIVAAECQDRDAKVFARDVD